MTRMKFCLQLNPQVSIEKPVTSLMPTLIEQVRVADRVGFDAFSMGDHYNIPGLQRLNQVPALARLCAEDSLGRNCKENSDDTISRKVQGSRHCSGGICASRDRGADRASR